jgi:hypothetical protein
MTAMPHSRPALLIACIALIAMFGVFAGARCYEPDTRAIVFIQGLYTTYDGETQSTSVEGPRFSTLKAAFLEAGYEDADLLDFSYNGGSVAEGGTNEGAWHPNRYPCEVTDRTAQASLSVLEDMLRAYREVHDGVHFTLVGHSLGGYLAYLEGVRESERSDDDRLDVDVIVTFDAPLRGVDADKKAIIDQIPCDKTYVAGAEIVADKQRPDLDAQRAAEVAMLADAGVRLANIGNKADCLWNTGYCLPGQSWIDDSGTQYLDGATHFPFEVSSNPFESHDAILGHAPAVDAAVGFIGEP